MIIQLVLLIVGFVLLIKGAEWMVGGASALAKKYRVSDLAIGLTIVAFGTSAPEMVVNAIASYGGHPEIVLGSVIGSNNFNLFVILGIVGTISPIAVQSRTVSREIPLSLLAVVMLFLLSSGWLYGTANHINRMDGIILLTMFAFFLWFVYTQMKSDEEAVEVTEAKLTSGRIVLLIVAGLAGLIYGGKLVVDQAIAIATQVGVSEKTIGLTIVAAGTSLPELVTSIVAVTRSNNDMATGNIIGSNIFNFCLVVPICALIQPINYDPVFNQDLLFLAAGTLFLLVAMFTGGKRKLDRWEAVIFVLGYLAYTYYLASREFVG